MLVSWNWLKDFVTLDMSPDELEQRLAMSGLNHEGTERLADDLSIDLEVTSNRPDCLGHIGVAREIASLWRSPLSVKDPNPAASGNLQIEDLTKVTIDCLDLCPRYTARVIKGIKIGPSPGWLVDRLRAVFRKQRKDAKVDEYQPINNVVDITNYVMMECGQPLHAFDLRLLKGPEIIVRPAAKGEKFQAIDHRTYELDPNMCVIADAERAIALGGVMGGADSEVSTDTQDLLIEAADFDPLSIRKTARTLNLHSPSSYRFERGVDPEGIDWASRRCCELILELAGGSLAEGVIDAGSRPVPPAAIPLRFSQIRRILGIEVGTEEVRRILLSLGASETSATSDRLTVTPPSWRRDLTREIDLLEEVARIHGYDKIPEDVAVPMAPSHRSDSDRCLAKVRHCLTGAGFDEAMTASAVPVAWTQRFRPWSSNEPLRAATPMLKGADSLRQSLTPSLLEARRVNESLSNLQIQLFEIARVYLPCGADLPAEQTTLAITSGADFAQIKGVVEAITKSLTRSRTLQISDADYPWLDSERSCEFSFNGTRLGVLGELSEQARQDSGLRSPATIAEMNLDALVALAELTPQHRDQSPYPPMQRDLNLIVDEALRWAALEQTIWSAGGDLVEAVEFRDIYRDPQKDGASRKRMLFSVTLRSPERTLTGDQADRVRDDIVSACKAEHAAELLE